MKITTTLLITLFYATITLASDLDISVVAKNELSVNGYLIPAISEDAEWLKGKEVNHKGIAVHRYYSKDPRWEIPAIIQIIETSFESSDEEKFIASTLAVASDALLNSEIHGPFIVERNKEKYKAYHVTGTLENKQVKSVIYYIQKDFVLVIAYNTEPHLVNEYIDLFED